MGAGKIYTDTYDTHDTHDTHTHTIGCGEAGRHRIYKPLGANADGYCAGLDGYTLAIGFEQAVGYCAVLDVLECRVQVGGDAIERTRGCDGWFRVMGGGCGEDLEARRRV